MVVMLCSLNKMYSYMKSCPLLAHTTCNLLPGPFLDCVFSSSLILSQPIWQRLANVSWL